MFGVFLLCFWCVFSVCLMCFQYVFGVFLVWFECVFGVFLLCFWCVVVATGEPGGGSRGNLGAVPNNKRNPYQILVTRTRGTRGDGERCLGII